MSSATGIRRAPLQPLHLIAIGVLLLALEAPTPAGYDLLPDPLGWVMVGWGTARLAPGAGRRPLLALVALAGLVDAALWVPAVLDAVTDADPALRWTANLPQLGAVVVLCLDLAARARRHPDASALTWWRLLAGLYAVLMVLPVLVFGGGVAAIGPVADTLVALAPLLLATLLLTFATRPWAAGFGEPRPSGGPAA